MFVFRMRLDVVEEEGGGEDDIQAIDGGRGKELGEERKETSFW